MTDHDPRSWRDAVPFLIRVFLLALPIALVGLLLWTAYYIITEVPLTPGSE